MPHSAIFKSSDPYEHQSSIRAGEVELLVTAPGSFHAELTRVDLHRLWMQRSREVTAADSPLRNCKEPNRRLLPC